MGGGVWWWCVVVGREEPEFAHDDVLFSYELTPRDQW